MNCSEAEKRIQHFIDRKLTATEEAAYIEHIRNCSSCRQELMSQFTIDHVLKSMNGTAGDDISYDMRSLLNSRIIESEKWIKAEKLRKRVLYTAVALGEVAAAACVLFEMRGGFVWNLIEQLLGK